MLLRTLFAALVFWSVSSSCRALGQEEIVIETEDGEQVFRVEVATTPKEFEYGLMYRTDLPEGTGMLFPYPRPALSKMWMKNTYIPLDILFFDGEGTLVFIAEETTPLSLEPLGPGTPVLSVLEIGGGEAARRGIKPGNKLLRRDAE